MALTKLKLLDTVLLPKEGTQETVPHHRDETVSVEADIAERLIRVGVAEKA